MKLLRSRPLVALSLILGTSLVLALSGCGSGSNEADDSGTGGNDALGGDSGSETGGSDGTGATGSGGEAGEEIGGADGLGGQGGDSNGSGGDGSGGSAPTCVEPNSALKYWWAQTHYPGSPPIPGEEFDEIDVLNRAQAHIQGVQSSSSTSAGIVGWSLAFEKSLFLQCFNDQMPFNTVEFWTRTSSSKAKLAVAFGGYDLSIDGGLVKLAFWDMGEEESSGPEADSSYRLVSTTRIDDGQDHHVATTFELESEELETGRIRLFIDGQQEDEVALDDSVFFLHLIANGGMSFGGNAGDQLNPKFFAGFLDEISLYDAPLSASEIQGIFEAGSAGKCMPEVEEPQGPQGPVEQ